jgi:cytochrome c
MPLRLFVTAAFLFAATAAFAGPKDAAVARGEAIVRGSCAMCHAVGATGDSPNPRAPHFRDLHDRYPIEYLTEALAEGIMVGHSEMPQFRFSPREVDDIIAYLESIQTRQHASSTGSAPLPSSRAPRPGGS